MDYSERNKKVALARWKKVQEKEKSKIKNDKDSKIKKAGILGFLAGDGSLTIRQMKKGKHYEVRLFADDKGMVDDYLELFFEVYNKKPQVTMKGNMYQVRLTSKIIVQDIQKYGDLSTSNWEIPQLTNKKQKIAWIKGFYSAEAYVGKNVIKVQTVNKKGMKQLSEILKELLIDHKKYVYNSSNANEKEVHIICILRRKARRKYYEEIGFWHSKKTNALKKALDL